jgi:hypothetical protein
MGSTSQLYSLSWGEFGSSLASAVQLLRGHGDLVDVTLAAGGRSFSAHKIVLSAASPFLLDLLKVYIYIKDLIFICLTITKHYNYINSKFIQSSQRHLVFIVFTNCLRKFEIILISKF